MNALQVDNNKERANSDRCIDLGPLYQRTRKDPALLKEMISLYLEQTPVLINAMKQSLKDTDWKGLHMAAHRMIPSFSIMGIHVDFENIAKKVQEYAIAKEHGEGLADMVLQLEHVCVQACHELEDELQGLKAQTHAK